MLQHEFWQNRRVLLTGHTGFKGAWMALLLEELGATVFGISLPPKIKPNLYEILSPWPRLLESFCDIRYPSDLQKMILKFNPELVIHMAAQPLVRESYLYPVETIETNVMGTIYLLDILRNVPALKAALVITTDKVYLNPQNRPQEEGDPLGGDDPYSASKSAVEILTSSYACSYFKELNISLCTARSGNVIGGGDWAKDRIIPDLWRASKNDETILLRQPNAVRPWQYILDPLYGYLLYLQQMATSPGQTPSSLNFGPSENSFLTVAELADEFSRFFSCTKLYVKGTPDPRFQEKHFLALNPSLAKSTLGWECFLKIDQAIDWTCHWYKAWNEGIPMRSFSRKEISKYLSFTCCETQGIL